MNFCYFVIKFRNLLEKTPDIDIVLPGVEDEELPAKLSAYKEVQRINSRYYTKNIKGIPFDIPKYPECDFPDHDHKP